VCGRTARTVRRAGRETFPTPIGEMQTAACGLGTSHRREACRCVTRLMPSCPRRRAAAACCNVAKTWIGGTGPAMPERNGRGSGLLLMPVRPVAAARARQRRASPGLASLRLIRVLRVCVVNSYSSGARRRTAQRNGGRGLRRGGVRPPWARRGCMARRTFDICVFAKPWPPLCANSNTNPLLRQYAAMRGIVAMTAGSEIDASQCDTPRMSNDSTR
jgi:hypothetical protein